MEGRHKAEVGAHNPPTASAFSNTRAVNPACKVAFAEARPAGPAPKGCQELSMIWQYTYDSYSPCRHVFLSKEWLNVHLLFNGLIVSTEFLPIAPHLGSGFPIEPTIRDRTSIVFGTGFIYYIHT
jgi:hypothetical protein